MSVEKFADFVRGMTRLDGQRLRDAIGDDNVQRFADLLGVEIEDREERKDYEAIADAAMKRCRELETENKRLRKQLAEPVGAKARAAE
jgi:hypothetical protein